MRQRLLWGAVGLVMPLLLLGAGCGESAPTTGPDTAPPATSSYSGTDTGASASAATPVTYTYVGLSSNKKGFQYRFQIDAAAKPVSEAAVAYNCVNSAGEEVEKSTMLWQNVVNSEAQPIVSGKTYEGEWPIEGVAERCETSLKRVSYTDGTRWTP